MSHQLTHVVQDSAAADVENDDLQQADDQKHGENRDNQVVVLVVVVCLQHRHVHKTPSDDANDGRDGNDILQNSDGLADARLTVKRCWSMLHARVDNWLHVAKRHNGSANPEHEEHGRADKELARPDGVTVSGTCVPKMAVSSCILMEFIDITSTMPSRIASMSSNHIERINMLVRDVEVSSGFALEHSATIS